MKKRNQQHVLIAGGVITAMGCLALIYVSHRTKQRDRLAAEIIKEINRQLKPATTGLLSEKAFDLHYKDEVLSRTPKQILTLKNEVINEYANQIHKAWGSWWTGGDDEKQVYAAFRKLKDKVQVSQLASAYFNRYGINLIDQLSERLDSKEIDMILRIVRPLPAYRTV